MASNSLRLWRSGQVSEQVYRRESRATACIYPSVGRLQDTPGGCISAVRNNRVVATKPKSTVTFDVDGVARFTFFRREDRSDRSNKLITG